MASRKARAKKFFEAIKKTTGGARRIRRVDEAATLEWARLAEARIRRLVRVTKEEVGERRKAALSELDQLRRSTAWPAEDRVAERVRIALAEQARAIRLYRDVLPDVVSAKEFFVLGSEIDEDVIDAYSRTAPRFVALSKALQFEWTTALARELKEMKPSDWLMARFAKRMRCSKSTVKKLLHQRPRGSK